MEIDLWIVPFSVYFMAKAAQDAALAESWGFQPKAKYKDPLISASQIKSKIYRMYHKLFGLEHQERFLFSATLLVMWTDAWHSFGTIRHICVVWLCWLISGELLSDALFMYAYGLLVFNVGFRLLRLI